MHAGLPDDVAPPALDLADTGLMNLEPPSSIPQLAAPAPASKAAAAPLVGTPHSPPLGACCTVTLPSPCWAWFFQVPLPRRGCVYAQAGHKETPCNAAQPHTTLLPSTVCGGRGSMISPVHGSDCTAPRAGPAPTHPAADLHSEAARQNTGATVLSMVLDTDNFPSPSPSGPSRRPRLATAQHVTLPISSMASPFPETHASPSAARRRARLSWSQRATLSTPSVADPMPDAPTPAAAEQAPPAPLTVPDTGLQSGALPAQHLHAAASAATHVTLASGLARRTCHVLSTASCTTDPGPHVQALTWTCLTGCWRPVSPAPALRSAASRSAAHSAPAPRLPLQLPGPAACAWILPHRCSLLPTSAELGSTSGSPDGACTMPCKLSDAGCKHQRVSQWSVHNALHAVRRWLRSTSS